MTRFLASAPTDCAVKVLLVLCAVVFLSGFFHNRPSSQFQQAVLLHQLSLERGDYGDAESQAKSMLELSRRGVGTGHWLCDRPLLIIVGGLLAFVCGA